MFQLLDLSDTFSRPREREADASASFVAVVKTADFRHGDDGSDGCLSDRPAIRGLLFQPEMRPAPVIAGPHCLDILQSHGIEPAPERGTKTPWSMFLAAHWTGLRPRTFSLSRC